MTVDYHIYNITIILVKVVREKRKSIVGCFNHGCFFHYRGSFFFIIVGVLSLLWVLFPYSIYSNIIKVIKKHVPCTEALHWSDRLPGDVD